VYQKGTLEMAVTWADSASKHGVPREDALWALTHFIYEERGFEVARPPATVAPDLYIGPQRSRTAPLLEVMLERHPPRACGYFMSWHCGLRSGRG